MNITFSGQTRTGWVGLGVNTQPQMIGGNMVVGWIDNYGNATLTARVALQESQPVLATSVGDQNFVLNYVGVVQTINGQPYLTFNFTRPLIVTGPYAISITPNETLFLLWAIGPEGGVDYATGNFIIHRVFGLAEINFFNGCVPLTNTNLNVILLRTHAILMLSGWTVFIFGGSYIARYMKTIGPLWFKLHVISQTIGLACIATAFIIVQYDLHGQTIGLHQLFGLFTFIAAIAQPLLGTLADRLYKRDRKNPPCFPDIVHWYVGRIAMLLSVPTIFLGINLFIPTHYVAYALYSAWVTLALVILIVNELQIGQRSEQKDWEQDTNKPLHTDEIRKAKRNVLRNFFVFMGIGVVLIAGLLTIVGTAKSSFSFVVAGTNFCS